MHWDKYREMEDLFAGGTYWRQTGKEPPSDMLHCQPFMQGYYGLNTSIEQGPSGRWRPRDTHIKPFPKKKLWEHY